MRWWESSFDPWIFSAIYIVLNEDEIYLFLDTNKLCLNHNWLFIKKNTLYKQFVLHLKNTSSEIFRNITEVR